MAGRTRFCCAVLPIVEILLQFVICYGSETSSEPPEHSKQNDHSDHEHEVLVFMFGALIVGTIILHLTTLPSLRNLQFTVVLFVSGALLSIVLRAAAHGGAGRNNMIYRSYEAWVNIDPHLVLFVFLPPLIFDDAMRTDTHIARRTARQCMILAGPGVAIGAFSTALVIHLLYKWDFSTSLTVGSILSATDPVAVVSLLKELGAPPTLTMQLQGESLLNDGTAIVLFSIAYHYAGGNKYAAGEIVLELVYSIVGASLLGLTIGTLFLHWIRSASDKLNHNSSLIQISLTIACAYWSFYLAEGVFHISGVLSTVSSALLLAHKMWPVIVAKPAMLDTWRVIETFGNTLVFFLAGAMTGKVMLQTDILDYVWLLVLYVAVICIRFLMILLLWPALNYVGKKLTPKEILVMTWGGLRGMVGLSLAIFVRQDRAEEQISEEDGDRILFLVGGIAALTLIVNATTAPWLAHRLRITTTDEARNILINNVADRAQSHVNGLLDELLQDARNARLCYPGALRVMVDHLNEAVRGHLPAVEDNLDEDMLDGDLGWNRQTSTESKTTLDTILSWLSTHSSDSGNIEKLLKRFEKSQKLIEDASTAKLCAFQYAKQMHDIKKVLAARKIDRQRLTAVREVFLETLRASYWEQVQKGRIASSTSEPTLLFNSVNIAKECCGFCLADWEILQQDIALKLQTGAFLEMAPQRTRSSRSNYSVLARSAVLSRGMTAISASVSNLSFLPHWKCCKNRLCMWRERRHRKRKFNDQALAVHCILAFLQAHSDAQAKIALYFGADADVDSAEEAYVILESQEEVYMAAAAYSKISKAVQMRVNTTSEFLRIAEQYRGFVISVHKSGVIQAKEAELLLHPLAAGIRQIIRERNNAMKLNDKHDLTEYDAAARIQRFYRQWRFLHVVSAMSKERSVKPAAVVSESECKDQLKDAFNEFETQTSNSIEDIDITDGIDSSCKDIAKRHDTSADIKGFVMDEETDAIYQHQVPSERHIRLPHTNDLDELSGTEYFA